MEEYQIRPALKPYEYTVDQAFSDFVRILDRLRLAPRLEFRRRIEQHMSARFDLSLLEARQIVEQRWCRRHDVACKAAPDCADNPPLTAE